MRQLQIEKDLKEKEAKRHALEKAKIAALIDKHRPRTPSEVNIPGTGINADINDKEGTQMAQPQLFLLVAFYFLLVVFQFLSLIF